MADWVEFRLKAVGALLSAQFIDISMRAAEVSFVEPADGDQASSFDEWRYYRRPAELQFWAIDAEREQAS